MATELIVVVVAFVAISVVFIAIAYRRAVGSGDDWDAVTMLADGLELRLGVAEIMQRDTFIEYLTRVTITPPEYQTGHAPVALKKALGRGV